jgi:Zn-finger nucleic acid-binding protein
MNFQRKHLSSRSWPEPDQPPDGAARKSQSRLNCRARSRSYTGVTRLTCISLSVTIRSMSDEIEPTEAPRSLTCPKCSSAMESISFHDIQVDRCIGCKGLWFDALEKDHLDLMSDSANIDTGATTPAVSTPPAQMKCPVCHTRMIEMVDHLHPKIHFESCKVCYGLFFDAGKYREHKEHNTLGFFHNLFHRHAR